jgi:hypothetical protein
MATFGLYGHFTATHGYDFSTAIYFLKLPHLRKVAVTTPSGNPGQGNFLFSQQFLPYIS